MLTSALRWVLPLVVAAATVAVSVPGAMTQAMWGDDVASARVLDEPDLAAAVRKVQAESSPPAWYVLAWSVSTVGREDHRPRPFHRVERLRLLSAGSLP